MVAFEVYVNGKRICTAGVGDNGVLTTIVTWAAAPPNREDLGFAVGGLISPRREHLRWADQQGLRVGDEVRVKIVERTKVDRPRSRKLPNPAHELRAKKAYVKRVAKELGWKIVAAR